jgi:hypothetical protein
VGQSLVFGDFLKEIWSTRHMENSAARFAICLYLLQLGKTSGYILGMMQMGVE